MDIDLKELIPAFLTETEEGLSAMEEALSSIESNEDDSELLATIFRAAHTLKGSASTIGLSSVATMAHEIENLLELLRDGRLRVNSERTSLLLTAVDVLRELVPRAVSGDETLDARAKGVLGLLAAEAKGPFSYDEPAPRTIELDLSDLLATGPEVNVPTVEVRRLASGPETPTLRVGLDKVDRLLDLTGEICIARGQTIQLLETDTHSRQSIVEAHRESDLLYMELQELVMKLRMVPVGPLFRKQIRTVRDLASTYGKRIRLEIEGQDVEVDTSVLEHLRDPLTHLVRNAFDHGIELPKQRRAAGKSPIGVIRLCARHDAGHIVVEIEDDGSGLDRGRIRQKAVERGIDAPEDMPERELDELIFEPGFTTAVAVTDLSGRGVGMDVVRRNIEALRGSVSVRSREGKGTTFTIRLPLTLAIIDGFYVGLRSDTFILPLENVVETLAFEPRGIDAQRSRGVLNLRSRPLPYVRLADLLGLGDGAPTRESVVVVRSRGRVYGLLVDELRGQAQTIIKPLPKMLRGISALSGSTILGGGEVAFILDVDSILAAVHGRGPRHGSDEEVGAGSDQTALSVKDSC